VRKRQQSKLLAVHRNGRMSRDIIPSGVRRLIRQERDARGLAWSQIGRIAGLGMREIQARSSVGKIGFRRSVIGRLAEVLRSRELERLAESDIYWDRIVELEALEPRPTYDLQIEGNHNFLANNLIVHNSHAASFALLVYDSAWLKCHEPAAFTCALLNSQPMGFYAPAQLVRDAREHGVEVRPVSVAASDWHCTLEVSDGPQPALRLGMCLAKSLAQTAAERIVEARGLSPFASVEDLAQRAALHRDDLEALAAAGALESLSGNRHLAFWEVAGVERPLPIAGAHVAQASEGRPMLAVPTERQGIEADYASLGFTLGRHPLALLRERFRSEGLLTSAELASLPHGKFVRTVGLVLLRQHPANANGVTFLTLEDETGQVNLIVWQSVGEAQRRPLVESRLLEVRGKLQRQGEILHLVAHRLIDRSELTASLAAASRDFH
jgi:error-prone DNA polymerase